MVERRIARRTDDVRLGQIVDGPRLIAMQQALELVYLDQAIVRYIVDAGPRYARASQDVARGRQPARNACRACSSRRAGRSSMGRDFVTPEDVKAVAVVGLAHRLTLRPELWVRRVTGEDVVGSLLDQVPTPHAEDVVPTR